jgi:hypothetical protein
MSGLPPALRLLRVPWKKIVLITVVALFALRHPHE